MRMRNKYRKPTTFPCNAGSRCSTSTVIWSLVAFLLMAHLFSLVSHREGAGGQIQLHTSHHPLFRELVEVEEENIQIPPPKGKRSPRATKRRPKRTTTLIDEFLDENSQLRHVFFPDMKTAINPMKDNGNDSFYYYPGRIWLDTEGAPIQAHGGGMLYDESSRTYYWYGEYKDGPTYHVHKKGAARLSSNARVCMGNSAQFAFCENSAVYVAWIKTTEVYIGHDAENVMISIKLQEHEPVDIIGVGCYSSKDLWTWKNEGIVLPAEETNETHDLHKSNVLERPKVVYNENTGKYVMWMHIDDCNYTKASVGVAISDYPTGPFDYLYSKRPHGFESRDMTIFKDTDGVAYLVYSSEDNSELHIGPLTSDYLDVTNVYRRILVGQHREAPALFKHEGTYYMITSGCTGWAPNEALAHAAESIMGPWETMGNPCIGGNKVFRLTTFFAQSTYVIPLSGLPGSYIFMADRWNPADLRESRYIWLPLIVGGPADRPLEYNFGFPLWSRVSIYWHKKWRLPPRWSV
ncbi:hypothetical protein JRO89_XS08G0218800 [Xanthoceras sorbifolium]|uniref:Glycosyl hydrolase family protein 43 n=1 Tax=Xanthoceras sorbifolium TaxID=99658 RepID=A0ABQ8HQS7_9ROSI|nr:hypothetical protein JRO89_XS08G0218800 [Xanthoceras sorbifolium]